jgi:hypothetical protein
VNGQIPALKKVTAVFPEKGSGGSPPCATVRADDDNVVVEVGAIFKRETGLGHQELRVKQPLK